MNVKYQRYRCEVFSSPFKSWVSWKKLTNLLQWKFIDFKLVPTATIMGGPDLHFDRGSTINLTCTINFSPEPPSHIIWYHLDEVTREKFNFCLFCKPKFIPIAHFLRQSERWCIVNNWKRWYNLLLSAHSKCRIIW